MTSPLSVNWAGVYPAVTTQMHADGALDLEATERHIDWLLAQGCHGLIMLGTVGENTSLSQDEKIEVLKLAKQAAGGRVPVLSGVAEFTTAQACDYARRCEKEADVDGLMVLPAMVYKADAREVVQHVREVADASGLPIMVYNNPPTYGIDITPPMFRQFEDKPTIVAIKETSENTRRITLIEIECGDRFTVFGGVDDIVLETLALGAKGWVSGLTNAFAKESVALWNMAQEGRYEEARALYRWFLPTLILDSHPKLVQYIKLAQAMVGLGTEHVRLPRLPLAGEERERVTAILRTAIDNRPQL